MESRPSSSQQQQPTPVSQARLLAALGVSLAPLLLYFFVQHSIETQSDSRQGEAAQVAITSHELLAPPADARSQGDEGEGQTESFELTILRNSSVFDTLIQLDLPADDILAAIQAASGHTDLANVRAGTPLAVTITPEPMRRLKYLAIPLSTNQTLEVRSNAAFEFAATVDVSPIEHESHTFQGVVRSNLWESATQAHMPTELVPRLAEIFAWQLDFERELRPEDRWRLVVDRHYVRGKPVGWGAIRAAEYRTSSETLSAIYHESGDGQTAGYYFPDGTSLRRMFLKSPMRFARISSRFQKRRFHPVLKVHRPHNGVDYAAAPGTPILAVGDGVVKQIKRDSIHGNMIRLRHNSVYETSYSHMKGFAKGMRQGQKVRQGQVIGYVGSTGLATGPHLHFAFYENGRFVDPLGRRFPSADPVRSSERDRFVAAADLASKTLPPWQDLAALDFRQSSLRE